MNTASLKSTWTSANKKQCNLLSLPVELQLEIFIIAQNPALAYACSHYWKITQSFVVRGNYILHRFGPEAALSERAVKQSIMSKEVLCYLLEQQHCNPVADEYWLFMQSCGDSQKLQVCEWLIKAIVRIYGGSKTAANKTPLMTNESRNRAMAVMMIRRLLNIASMKGSVQVIELLLDYFDIERLDPIAYQTMLDIACNENQLDVVCYLKEKHGFDLHIQDERYLREACLHGRDQIVDYLIQDGANVASLHNAALQNAAYRSHASIVHRLLKAGADANVNDSAALKYAVKNNDIASVKCLIHAGNANPRCHEDWPIRMACRNGQLSIVKLLLGYNVDPDTCNGAPLHEALGAGHENVVVVLLEHGADPNSLGALYGLRFLLESKDTKNYVLVKLMTEAGSDCSKLDY
jgi:ankyrin repeat protein